MKRRFISAAHQLVLSMLLWLIGTSGWAQRIGAITFHKLPQDYQLYPRNERSEAQLAVSGRVEEGDWQYVSVQVSRNNQPASYKRVALSYANGQARFAIDPVTIRAERAEYDLSVYLVKGADSVNVVTRQHIVSGDVYVLTGQSNASNFFRETRTNEFCRTFGKTSGTYGTEPYNPADTAWAISNQTLLTQNVGTLGFEFQQLILEKYGIPTCLINGAFHWSMMAHHATRTPNNPADLTNGYGRLLYRLQKGGIDKAVKALILRQGESEAYGEGINWGGDFDTYYKNLKTDLPAIKQLYVFQVDIIDAGVAAAPVVRESQRALVDKYPDIQVLPNMGATGFDGLHYADEGYIQNAEELTRLVGRDFYNSSDVDNIDAPNIRRVYYSNAERTSLTLEFGEGQAVNWNEQLGTLLLKNYFYPDGLDGQVSAGKAVGSRIVLTLKNPLAASKLTYMPPKNDPSTPDTPFRGPYITNKRGMRALSFYEFPISGLQIDSPPLLSPSLTIGVVSPTALQLVWTEVPTATTYVVERQDPQAGTFKLVTQLPAGTLTYQTDGLLANTDYVFRLKALGTAAESAWVEVRGKTPAYLASPELITTLLYNNEVDVIWKPIPGATAYQVERQAGAGEFQKLGTFGPATMTIKDTGLQPGTTYTYRIKAIGDKTESPVSSVSVSTPALLNSPVVSLVVLYYNALQVNWQAVPSATGYQLNRKTAGQAFEKLGTFTADKLSFTDTTVQAGTAYTYSLQALGRLTESVAVTANVQLPALLPTPTISLSVIYNNIVHVNWSAVPNATAYQIERYDTTRGYHELGTFTPGTVSFRDTSLTPGTTYTYRVTAIGDKTESPTASLSATTPNQLSQPELRLMPTSFDAIELSWKVTPNAAYYLLERRTAGGGAYGNPVRLDGQQSQYNDSQLSPNTTYQYRLTAYGDKTQSIGVLAEGTTLMLLAVGQEPLVEVSVWPNPAPEGQVSVRFSGPVSGTLQVLDIRGVVHLEQLLTNADHVPLTLTGYPAGVYLVCVKRANDKLVKRLVIR